MGVCVCACVHIYTYIFMKGIDLSDSEQEDYVMKRQSAGGGDKYPQDKVPEQRADGMC